MTSLDLLNGDPSFQRLLLADLSETAKALFTRIWQLDTGPALLWLLCARPRTSMTAEDIAFRLGESPQLVERDLESLVRLGVVRITHVCDFTVFSLTPDGERRRLVQELCTWHDRWEERLGRMRHIVMGQREEAPKAETQFHQFSD